MAMADFHFLHGMVCGFLTFIIFCKTGRARLWTRSRSAFWQAAPCGQSGLIYMSWIMEGKTASFSVPINLFDLISKISCITSNVILSRNL